jgi:phosphatidylinositol glycan class V
MVCACIHRACRKPQAKYCLSPAFPSSIHISPIVKHALTDVAISHISHLGAVLALYSSVQRIIPSNITVKRRIAFTAACLHIISPAGLFLSSPYGESTFAFTAFVGLFCYIRALEQYYKSAGDPSELTSAAWTVLSGFFFAVSTLIRSNGLLHGTIFLVDAIHTIHSLSAQCKGLRDTLRSIRLLSVIFAGSLIAVAFALPQAIAYAEFCTASDSSRPWCARTIPSIYSWVQKEYWNVGFLSYWTPGNIPLFLLAAPVLIVLVATALSVTFKSNRMLAGITGGTKQSIPAADIACFKHVALQLALPQLILAIMALTSFHVQIINRISSGCALWYIVLAIAVNDCSPGGFEGGWGLFSGGRTAVVVRLMAGYAIVQGGLYASFLPPA